jgi:hypothetical protein
MIEVLTSFALAVAPTAPACGRPETARARVAAVEARFQVGMTFADVVAAVGPPAALKEYWGQPPRERMGPWIIFEKDGARVATKSISCDFDSSDRLLRCMPEVEMWEQQRISDSAYEKLKVGDTLASVLEDLCEPGKRTTRGDGTLMVEYWVLHPTARHNTDCPAYLSFRDDRLVKKVEQCR